MNNVLRSANFGRRRGIAQALSRGRARAVAAAGFAILFAAPAEAQLEDGMTRANRGAYAAAMTCFVVNGSASAERGRAGDAAKKAYYEQKARESFDTALRLGETLGYSGTRMDEDFGLAQARELPRIATDVAYYRSAASTCKALGLM